MLTSNCFTRSTTNVITTNTSDLEKLVIQITYRSWKQRVYLSTLLKRKWSKNCRNSLKSAAVVKRLLNCVFLWETVSIQDLTQIFRNIKLGFICSTRIWMKKRVVANLPQSEFYLNRNSNLHSALAFERAGLIPRSAILVLNWYKFNEITRLTE